MYFITHTHTQKTLTEIEIYYKHWYLYYIYINYIAYIY